MAAYKDKVDEMARSFMFYKIKYVRQADNMAVDTLSRLGSSRKAFPPGVLLEHIDILLVKMAYLKNPEHASLPVLAVMPTTLPWTKPYMKYLTNKTLHVGEVTRRQTERRAKVYTNHHWSPLQAKHFTLVIKISLVVFGNGGW
jgi:hypothetical protein